MKIIDLLNCQSLQQAEVIVSPIDLDTPVTGINILEATDIERWAKPGMVILSSYFALQSHNYEELEIFFEKLKQFGIACLIIKVDRLVKEIPDQFIHLCQKNAIPLIRIGGAIKYEDIIVEVLTFILGNREQRLALYYKVSKISSEMTLEMLSIREILDRFKTFLGFNLTLMGKERRAAITTNKHIAKFSLGNEVELFTTDYMTFGYKRYECYYQTHSGQPTSSVLVVEFSSSEESGETLAIHETQNHKVDENDIVVIENLIRCLQLNLLREFSGRQKMLFNKNTIINDLLRGMITDPVEFETICNNLGIDPNGYCQVLTVIYSTSQEADLISLYEIKNQVRLELIKLIDRIVYYVTPRYDQFILSYTKGQPISFIPEKIKASFDSKIENEEFIGKISYYGGVSNIFSVKEISSAGSQSMAVADFLSQNSVTNIVRDYKNLGLFKLFLGKDAAKINEIVPEELLNLRAESEELFLTLSVYMKNNRNFKLTAEKLFLHPKTVKYRINKVINDYHLDLENMYFVTLIMAAIEVLEFKDGIVTGESVTNRSHPIAR